MRSVVPVVVACRLLLYDFIYHRSQGGPSSAASFCIFFYFAEFSVFRMRRRAAFSSACRLSIVPSFSLAPRIPRFFLSLFVYMLFCLITFYCPLYKLLAFAGTRVGIGIGFGNGAKSILLRCAFLVCNMCPNLCSIQINTKEIYLGLVKDTL